MAEVLGNVANYAEITPSDTTVVGVDGIYIGTGGNLVLQAYEGGPSVTFVVHDGSYHPLQAHRVMAATTATGVVGLKFV